MVRSNVCKNRYFRTCGSSAEYLRLAVMTVPIEVGDRGMAKCNLRRERWKPVNRWCLQRQRRCLHYNKEQTLELKTAYEINAQSKSGS